MSEQNLELVRAYYAALDEILLARQADPTTPLDAGTELLFERFLDPEAEWSPPFRPEVFRGREGFVRAAEDWLEVADGWKVELDELRDGGGDTVLAVVRVFIQGKGSGAAYGQRTFTVISVTGGRISRISDFTEEAEAREAAGLPPPRDG